jgi:hypothetical protein
MVGARAQVTRGGPGAAPGREARARAAGARGGPGAAPSREAGARATGTHGSPGAAPNREAGAIVLTGCLYAGVPGLQGADNACEFSQTLLFKHCCDKF